MVPKRYVFESGTEPKDGRDYLTFQLTRRYGGNPRTGGPLTPSSWRVLIRSVGEGPNNARVLLDAGTGAVEDHTITVTGVLSTPLQFQGEDGIREDEEDLELYTGSRSFTYSF